MAQQPTLAEFQKSFDRALRDQNPTLTVWSAQGSIKPHEGWLIYQNNWLNRHLRALAETYPVCRRLVGAACFNALGKYYLLDHPSQHFDLNHYGKQFESLLRVHPLVSGLPYLSDVACLEWAYHRACFGPDIRHNQASQVAGCFSHSQSQFRLQENSSLVVSEYPIFKIWGVNHQKNEVTEAIDLAERGGAIFVIRHDSRVQLFPLQGPMPCALIGLLLHQKSLEEMQQYFKERGWGGWLEPLLKKMLFQHWIYCET